MIRTYRRGYVRHMLEESGDSLVLELKLNTLGSSVLIFLLSRNDEKG